MKVTNDKTENRQTYLTIEMEPAEMEEPLAASYRHLSARVNIPGFRKGKAPRAILERFLTRESVLEDAINYLVPQAYEKAIKEQNIEPIAQPQIEIVQTDPVVFKATVPLIPIIELGDYQHIEVKDEPAAVTDDNINAVIEELRHQHATWEPIERPAEYNDLTVIDVESSVNNEPYINQKGAQYQLLHDSSSPAPGFAEQLTGMNKGEEKSFKIKFPEDYQRKELAGKEASFKVKVTEVKKEKLPELNDELAKQVNAEYQTAEVLRREVAKNLQLRAEERAKHDFEEKVVETVVSLSRVEFPPVMAEAEIEQLLSDQSRRLQMSGISAEDYLKSINKTAEQLHEELHPVAEKRVTNSLVLGKVAEAEKIEASDLEIEAEIANMVKGADEKNRLALEKFLGAPESRESIRQTLMTRKTLERLVEIAKSGIQPQAEEKEDKK